MIDFGSIVSELYDLLVEARNLGIYVASPVFLVQAGVLVAAFLIAQLVRLEINFGASYEADPHEVRKIAIEAAKTYPRVENDPSPV